MRRNKKGFTVIEIILVLGIAGLIFLTIFLVVPSLWASERDAERRTKISEYVSALKEYQTNNSRGALPTGDVSSPLIFTATEARGYDASIKTTWQALIRDYFDKDFSDPDGIDFAYYVVKCSKLNPDGSSATAAAGERCEYPSSTQNAGGGKYSMSGGLKSANGDDISVNGGVNHVIYTVVGATCDGDAAVKSSNNRNVAVIYLLERAGRFCANT